MHMTKIVLLLGSLSLMTHSAVAAKIPKFGGYSKTSTTQMVNKSKTKSNQQKVKKHNGYKVIEQKKPLLLFRTLPLFLQTVYQKNLLVIRIN